jgi:succinoglycan biosynthesis protein ExoO
MVDVSVITAVWNGQHTINRAMMTALSQTGVPIELIVADDASTEATGSVVKSLDDQRIRYLQLPANGGSAAARNAAIDAARGNWIAILDADDMLLADRPSQLVTVASKNRLEIVTDDIVIEDSRAGDRSWSRPMPSRHGSWKHSFLPRLPGGC